MINYKFRSSNQHFSRPSIACVGVDDPLLLVVDADVAVVAVEAGSRASAPSSALRDRCNVLRRLITSLRCRLGLISY